MARRPARKPTRRIEFSNAVVATFTVVLAVIGAIQAWAFIQSERAFVAPTETNFAVELVPGIPHLPMLFEIKNSGKSTATIDGVWIAIAHDLPDPKQYGEAKRFTYPPIVPGGTSKRVIHFETGWGEPTNTAVKTGKMKLYLFGYINYHDEMNDKFCFLKKRETGFCYVYAPTGGVSEKIFETCQAPEFTFAR